MGTEYPVGTRVRVSFEATIKEKGIRGQMYCDRYETERNTSGNRHFIYTKDPNVTIEAIPPAIKRGDVWEANGIRFLATQNKEVTFMYSETCRDGDSASAFLLRYPNATRILEGK